MCEVHRTLLSVGSWLVVDRWGFAFVVVGTLRGVCPAAYCQLGRHKSIGGDALSFTCFSFLLSRVEFSFLPSTMDAPSSPSPLAGNFILCRIADPIRPLPFCEINFGIIRIQLQTPPSLRPSVCGIKVT